MLRLVRKRRWLQYVPIVGELVQLASGSPPLRVDLFENDHTHVTWSSSNNQLHHYVFLVTQLVPFGNHSTRRVL